MKENKQLEQMIFHEKILKEPFCLIQTKLVLIKHSRLEWCTFVQQMENNRLRSLYKEANYKLIHFTQK